MTAPDSEIERALSEIEKKNYSAAAAILIPLAQAGNPRAECNLASLYQCGWGVELNGPRAVELYEKVARRNIRAGHLSAIAYNGLATLYVTGLPGVAADPTKAKKYRQLSKELGFPT